MAGKLSLSMILQNLFLWGQTHVWSPNALLQFVLLVVCFSAGSLLARPVHERVTKAIETSKLPLRTKRIAKNSRRVIKPAIVLALLTVVSAVLNSVWVEEGFDYQVNASVIDAVTKVLSAWIVIRLSFQFVQNSLVRNFLTWTIWLVAALSIFGILDQTADAFDSFQFSLGSFHISALEFIKSILLLIILLYLALFISTFFERKVLKSKNLTRSSQVLIVKVIRIALIIVSVIIGITSAGIDLSIFAVFSGAIGLGIGFGLQRSVSNIFSGFLLLMDQSIKPGDVIEIEKGVYGVVNQMAARYTEVVTRDSKSYLIPNEDFITQRVVNWSHGNSMIRLEVFFGVHYKSDPREIITIALECAKKASTRISTDPEPLCYLREFGESALNFTLRFWITDAERGITNVKGAVLLCLWDAFKAHGVEIPYPQREVFMREEPKPKKSG